mmetsp:Transcript_84923/g.203543  ORF Transcript_84923/g.203543 Transcript_84923/m.203543 type:complete len:267 (+) Transcript_84923:793-1593(+)
MHLLMLELPAAELDGIEVAGFYQDLRLHVQCLHICGHPRDSTRGDGAHQRSLASAVSADDAVSSASTKVQDSVLEQHVATSIHHPQAFEVDQGVLGPPADVFLLLLVLDPLEDLVQEGLQAKGGNRTACGIQVLLINQRSQLLFDRLVGTVARLRFHAARDQDGADVLAERLWEAELCKALLRPALEELRAERRRLLGGLPLRLRFLCKCLDIRSILCEYNTAVPHLRRHGVKGRLVRSLQLLQAELRGLGLRGMARLQRLQHGEK